MGAAGGVGAGRRPDGRRPTGLAVLGELLGFDEPHHACAEPVGGGGRGERVERVEGALELPELALAIGARVDVGAHEGSRPLVEPAVGKLGHSFGAGLAVHNGFSFCSRK
jgi:hypothetical protein